MSLKKLSLNSFYYSFMENRRKWIHSKRGVSDATFYFTGYLFTSLKKLLNYVSCSHSFRRYVPALYYKTDTIAYDGSLNRWQKCMIYEPRKISNFAVF